MSWTPKPAGVLAKHTCVGLRGCEVGARDCESNVLVHDARVDLRTAIPLRNESETADCVLAAPRGVDGQN